MQSAIMDILEVVVGSLSEISRMIYCCRFCYISLASGIALKSQCLFVVGVKAFQANQMLNTSSSILPSRYSMFMFADSVSCSSCYLAF